MMGGSCFLSIASTELVRLSSERELTRDFQTSHKKHREGHVAREQRVLGVAADAPPQRAATHGA